MELKIKNGHWLNRAMDIETFHIDEDRWVAVCITGVEFVATPQGGRAPRIRYALRLGHHQTDLNSRSIATEVVEAALACGADVIQACFADLEKRDHSQSSFTEAAARFERALAFGLEEAAAKGKAAPRL